MPTGNLVHDRNSLAKPPCWPWVVALPRRAVPVMMFPTPEMPACVVSFAGTCAFSLQKVKAVMNMRRLGGSRTFCFRYIGCGYLNGVGPVIGTQMLVVVGLFFSLAALGDCSFVSLEERLFLPQDLDIDLPIIVTQTQYIGFLTWQRLDGYVACSCWSVILQKEGNSCIFFAWL